MEIFKEISFLIISWFIFYFYGIPMMINKVVNFHRTKNKENLDRFPIKGFIQNSNTIIKVYRIVLSIIIIISIFSIFFIW